MDMENFIHTLPLWNEEWHQYNPTTLLSLVYSQEHLPLLPDMAEMEGWWPTFCLRSSGDRKSTSSKSTGSETQPEIISQLPNPFYSWQVAKKFGNVSLSLRFSTHGLWHAWYCFYILLVTSFRILRVADSLHFCMPVFNKKTNFWTQCAFMGKIYI